MSALVAMALASLPAGGDVPDAFIGKYALMEVTKNGCDPKYALSISQDRLRLRGVDYAIVMEETINAKNIHIWVHELADKTNQVTEFHINVESGENGGVVLSSDRELAESAVKYGSPAIDAGVAGLFRRCPA